MTSDELVRHFVGEMGKLDARVRAAFDRLDEDGMNRPIPPSQWSPLQILDHMLRTNGPYLELLRTASPPAGGDREVKHSFFGKMLMKFAGPSGNIPAPPALRPSPGPLERTLVDRYLAQTAELTAAVAKLTGRTLDSYRISSPFANLIKLNLADVLAITIEHTERHVGQIEASLSETTQR